MLLVPEADRVPGLSFHLQLFELTAESGWGKEGRLLEGITELLARPCAR